jgi:hypothetical protein
LHEDGVVLHLFHEALLGKERVFPRIREAALPWMRFDLPYRCTASSHAASDVSIVPARSIRPAPAP